MRFLVFSLHMNINIKSVSAAWQFIKNFEVFWFEKIAGIYHQCNLGLIDCFYEKRLVSRINPGLFLKTFCKIQSKFNKIELFTKGNEGTS